MSKVSVVIPTIKGREDLLKKLLVTVPNNCEKIVMPEEKLALSTKRNRGAQQAKGEYFLFIDDDNFLKNGRFAINLMVESFDRDSKLGVLGMVACYDDKRMTIADGGSKRNMLTGFTKGLRTNRKINLTSQKNYEVDEVANAFMIPRSIFEILKGFDSHKFPTELDEADFCRRVKLLGFKVAMCPMAVCYHKSITYSHIPDFRRPRNAYYMGRNRVLYQKKFLSRKKYLIYLGLFLPMFVSFYMLSLLCRNKKWMIVHFMRGVRDGIKGRRKYKY